MSRIVFLISLVLCFQTCKETELSTQELQDQMNAVNKEIETLINLNCGEGTICKTLPVGAKPCGGPTHYVVFSSATNESVLQTLIDNYTSLNKKYNEISGIGSDCAIVNPPEVTCVEGVCQLS